MSGYKVFSGHRKGRFLAHTDHALNRRMPKNVRGAREGLIDNGRPPVLAPKELQPPELLSSRRKNLAWAKAEDLRKIQEGSQASAVIPILWRGGWWGSRNKTTAGVSEAAIRARSRMAYGIALPHAHWRSRPSTRCSSAAVRARKAARPRSGQPRHAGFAGDGRIIEVCLKRAASSRSIILPRTEISAGRGRVGLGAWP